MPFSLSKQSECESPKQCIEAERSVEHPFGSGGLCITVCVPTRCTYQNISFPPQSCLCQVAKVMLCKLDRKLICQKQKNLVRQLELLTTGKPAWQLGNPALRACAS